MPGLIRGVARTAAIAGTATAVSNRVSRRQAGRWAAQEQQEYAQDDGYGQPYPQQPPPQQAYATGGGTPPVDTNALRELGLLRSQGVLTEEEFQAQKSRLLYGG